MTQEQILDKLKNLMYAGDISVTLASHFANDLGYDSLDDVELIMKAEREFQITIPDGEAEDIRTVADMISCIEKQLLKKN